MSTLVDQDELMLKYQLRRVTKYWGLKSGGASGKKKRDISISQQNESEAINESAVDAANMSYS